MGGSGSNRPMMSTFFFTNWKIQTTCCFYEVTLAELRWGKPYPLKKDPPHYEEFGWCLFPSSKLLIQPAVSALLTELRSGQICIL